MWFWPVNEKFWEELKAVVSARVNCYWPSPARSNLVSGAVRNHGHVFIFQNFTYFEIGAKLRREGGSDYNCSPRL